ncbi:MAG: acetate--CoA ligase family protein, partial [Neisseriaceae bacterium]|nr:acetate--CoA ligase family protein [Neisseriaceae bacterium]
MKPHALTPLFEPKHIAVIGASDALGTIGQAILSNLLGSGYQGICYPVNRDRSMVAGLKAYALITHIEGPIDLAIITTPLNSLREILQACGEKNVKAVVLAQAYGEFAQGVEKGLLEDILAMAKRYNIRVLGPNVFGFMRPDIGLYASNYEGEVASGNLALVTQSSALCSAILDWASANQLGFSAVVPMGSGPDVNFGEVLDFLVTDPKTKGILLHLHHVSEARSFISALRAAARTKPVLVMKAGDSQPTPINDLILGTRLSSREVFNTVLGRSGVIRLDTVEQMMATAKLLAANQRVNGNRLIIISNGAGTSLLAADAAINQGVRLANLNPDSQAQLCAQMPANWQANNPVDVMGDASPARFCTAATICLNDDSVDGVLIVFSPQSGSDHMGTAKLLIKLQKKYKKPLLFCWMGQKKVRHSRDLFHAADMPCFDTPTLAISVFRHLAVFHHNQQFLLQTPSPLETTRKIPDLARAKNLIAQVRQNGRLVLSETESKCLLAAFHLPINPTYSANNAHHAANIAQKLGYPVQLKFDMSAFSVAQQEDILVSQMVNNEESLHQACATLSAQLSELYPQIPVPPFIIQAPFYSRFGRELKLAIHQDAVFGPIFSLGAGGWAERQGDEALALPPLNRFLVKRLITRTRLSKLLGAFKHLPSIDMTALEEALLNLSEWICELPDIATLQIDPLMADEKGVLILGARVTLRPLAPMSAMPYRPYAHMAIMPYPAHLIREVRLSDDNACIIRPVRPEDADAVQFFVGNLSPESRYNRYMSSIKQLPQSTLVRFTQLDYDREMALALVKIQAETQTEEMLGFARYTSDPDKTSCEFA